MRMGRGIGAQRSAHRRAVAIDIHLHLARFTSAFESDFDPWSVVEEGDFLPYLAPHQGNAQVSFIRGNHALEINARFASSMRVEAGQASPEPSHATDALTVLDAMYRYQVSEECYGLCRRQ